MGEQCGLSYPTWIRLGWVHWSGAPAREPLFTIEYKRCAKPAAAVVEAGKFTFHYCAAHSVEMTATNRNEAK